MVKKVVLAAVLTILAGLEAFSAQSLKALVDDAFVAFGRGDDQQALELAERAIGQIRAADAASAELLAQAYNARALAAGRQSRWELAVESARENLRLRQQFEPNGANHAIALGSLGILLHKVGEQSEAERHLDDAEALYQPWLAPSAEAAIVRRFGIDGPRSVRTNYCGLLSNSGAFAHERGYRNGHDLSFRRAEERLGRAIECYRDPRSNDRYREGIAQNNLGSLYLDWPARFDRAEATLQAALTLRLRNNDLGRAHTHTNLGRFYFLVGKPADSGDHLRRAIEIWKQPHATIPPGGVDDVAKGYVNFGLLLRLLGYTNDALEMFLQSRLWRPKASIPWERAATYEALITSEIELGAIEDAQQHLGEFAAMALSTGSSAVGGDVPVRYWLLVHLAEASSARKEAAFAAAERAVTAAGDQPRSSLWLKAKRVFGKSLVEMGRHDEAVALLSSIADRDLAGDGRMAVLHDLAWTRGQRALRYSAAEPAYLIELQTALEASDAALSILRGKISPQLPFTCGDLTLEAGDDFSPMIELNVLLRRLVADATTTGAAEEQARLRLLLDGALAALQLKQALDGAAIERGAISRRLHSAEAREAWRLLEVAMAKQCRRLRVGADISISAPGSGTMSSPKVQSPSEIETSVATVGSAEASLAPEIRRLLAQSRETVGLDRLQPLIEPNEAIATYVIAEDAAFAVLIGREDVGWRALKTSRARLAQDVANLRQGLQVDPQGGGCGSELVEMSRTLYRTLIEPLRKGKFASIERLLIIPDDELSTLPFAALSLGPDAASGEQDGCGERWLAGEMKMSFVPSLQGFVRLRDTAPTVAAERRYLGLSDPRPDAKLGLRPLPSAAAGVAAAADLFPADHRVVLTGSSATPAAFAAKSKDATIVHIAAHAERAGIRFGAVEPILALSADPPANPQGVMPASAISCLNLDRTQIVVLSACETALDDNARYGALAAFPRAFFAMGVQSVVATMWLVDSPSAAAFDEAFARAAFQQGASTIAAVGEAQKAISHKAAWRHPYFWAAFVHFGAPR